MQLDAKLIVIDTNVVLDLWGFGDPRTHLWAQRLDSASSGPSLRWIATAAMRDELHSVLTRPHLIDAFAARGRSAQGVAEGFDRFAKIVPRPEPLPQALRVHCSDCDDQKFIDLALARQAILLTKDKALIKCKKRLASRGVTLIVPSL